MSAPALLQRLAFSTESYALLVAATAVAGVWRTRWPQRACGLALFAAWAASRLLAGRLEVHELSMAYGLMHGVILALTLTLLLSDGALWLALLAGATLLEFAAHMTVVLDAATPEPQLARAYDVAIRVLFSAQLASIWVSRTRVGRWWPRSWRPPDLRV